MIDKCLIGSEDTDRYIVIFQMGIQHNEMYQKNRCKTEIQIFQFKCTEFIVIGNRGKFKIIPYHSYACDY
jgi:hypothetical protein